MYLEIIYKTPLIFYQETEESTAVYVSSYNVQQAQQLRMYNNYYIIYNSEKNNYYNLTLLYNIIYITPTQLHAGFHDALLAIFADSIDFTHQTISIPSC